MCETSCASLDTNYTVVSVVHFKMSDNNKNIKTQ